MRVLSLFSKSSPAPHRRRDQTRRRTPTILCFDATIEGVFGLSTQGSFPVLVGPVVLHRFETSCSTLKHSHQLDRHLLVIIRLVSFRWSTGGPSPPWYVPHVQHPRRATQAVPRSGSTLSRKGLPMPQPCCGVHEAHRTWHLVPPISHAPPSMRLGVQP